MLDVTPEQKLKLVVQREKFNKVIAYLIILWKQWFTKCDMNTMLLQDIVIGKLDVQYR